MRLIRGRRMNYYIEEIRLEKDKESVKKHAGGKAREDVHSILIKEKYTPIEIKISDDNREKAGKLDKIKMHWDVYTKWKRSLKGLKKGDSIVFQYPILDHSLFMGRLGRKLRKKGVKVILLVHDLSLFRTYKDIKKSIKIRQYIEEEIMLKQAYKIIVHNEKMKQALNEKGFDVNKMISLELFDYIIPNFKEIPQREYKNKKTIIVAGNLMKSKTGYIYKLPEDVKFNLYGVGYEGSLQKDNITYMGSFLPEKLPFEMVGDFGLVWDGPDSDACTGTYGEYLKVNNPHKTSLYLASGLPVIIWKDAALAEFVTKNGVGLVVNSLNDISDIIKELSEKDYMEMINNVKTIQKKLLEGYYLKNALLKCGEKGIV